MVSISGEAKDIEAVSWTHYQSTLFKFVCYGSYRGRLIQIIFLLANCRVNEPYEGVNSPLVL